MSFFAFKILTKTTFFIFLKNLAKIFTKDAFYMNTIKSILFENTNAVFNQKRFVKVGKSCKPSKHRYKNIATPQNDRDCKTLRFCCLS